MKLLLFLCAATLVVAEESPSAVGYHARSGIPQAEQIRVREAMEARIVGGMVTYTGENPFLAGLIISLTNGMTSVCAGALLNSNKVLTAGQCWFDGYSQGKTITVVLGSPKLFTGGERRKAYSIAVHPQFDPYDIVNDLAMLSIEAVELTKLIQLALLPMDVNDTFLGRNARVSGYGITSDGDTITKAQEQHTVYVQVISNTQCEAAYRRNINDSIICTAGNKGWGPCLGDAGAPLVISPRYRENVIIGVSSFYSDAGCQSGSPFGYTRVTAYLSWIQSEWY